MFIFLVDGCPTGYTGKYCETACSFPRYGYGCQRFCLCSKHLCDVSIGCLSNQIGKFFYSKTIKQLKLLLYWNQIKYKNFIIIFASTFSWWIYLWKIYTVKPLIRHLLNLFSLYYSTLIFIHYWPISMCFTLCNPTPCLFRV